MTQVTHRSPTLSPYDPRRPRSSSSSAPLPPRAGWFLEGVLAAGLGLGALAVLVLLLWIVSPYPESSAGGALHIAADLWLLAHGSALVRTETLSGVPAPIALTPMLLVIAPVWLLYRAFVQALSEGGDATGGKTDATQSTRRSAERSSGKNSGKSSVRSSEPGPGTESRPDALTPLVCVAGGYLLTAAVTVLFASAGPVHADVLSALVRLPLFVVCVAVAAMWPAWGRADPAPLDGPGASAGSARRATGGSLSRAMREVRTLARRLNPLHTALVAVAVLCGGGLLVAFGTVLWRGDEVHSAFPRLAGESWAGQFAVLLLVVALLPNAAVWAAAYGLGPGFALGAGTVVGPLADGGGTRLPPFPLLEALPAPYGGYGLLACSAAGAAPLAAAATIGWYVARAAVPEPGRRAGAAGRGATVCVVVLVACACGAGLAALAAFSGGALGTEAMSLLGPDWCWTGVAASTWALLVGTPVALTLRAWRLRESGHGDDADETAARRARWTALKAASGGLMPDFEPRRD